MPATHLLRSHCPECKKPAVQESTFVATIPKTIDGVLTPVKQRFIILKCGHTLTKEKAGVVDFSDIVSFKGHKPFTPFQLEAAERVVKADFKALLRLDVGLGKTIISLMLIRKYWKQLTPLLIICKSSLTVQWMMEWLDWVPGRLVQVFENGRDKPNEGFKAFIVSMDLIAPRWNKKKKAEVGGLPWLRDHKFKTIFFDEIQHIKNPDAARTKFVQDLAAKATNFIELGATPIKNNFGEYFNALNILEPNVFRFRSQFYDTYVEHYFDDYGRLHSGGLKKSRYDDFKRATSKFIIDYKRADVMPDLPEIFRQYRYFNLDVEDTNAYSKEMGNFLEAYDDAEYMSGQDKFQAKQAIGASLMRMRQIVGLAKVEPVVEDVLEWLDANDEEQDILVISRIGDKAEHLRAKPKIVIFIHHIDVGTVLQSNLDGELAKRGIAPCARLLGGIGVKSAPIEEEFCANPARRVLIASTLAAGEGKNFQFCSNAVLMERQWNPPNEEQAEGRFPRPGTTARQINVVYPVAVGTVDELLAEIVEKKRCDLKTVDGKWGNASESEIMQELTQRLATEGRQKWRP